MASNHCKPDGLFVITPGMGAGFVETLPVGKFHGIGPVTCAKMERLGIRTGRDLKAQTLPFLEQHFGKAGPYYYWLARGIDKRPVSATALANPSVSKTHSIPISILRKRSTGAPADHRKSMESLRADCDSWTHGDPEGEVC